MRQIYVYVVDARGKKESSCSGFFIFIWQCPQLTTTAAVQLISSYQQQKKTDVRIKV